MKTLLTIFLAGMSTLATAQKKVNLNRSVDDDGKTLSVRVEGTICGKAVDFEKTFDVEDLDKEERAELREKILSSIGNGNIKDIQKAPRSGRNLHVSAMQSPPDVPTPPSEPVTAYLPNELNPNSVRSENVTDQDEEKNVSLPFTKLVKYNSESGELFLKYSFTKESEEFIFEKTINAAGKSEDERQRIIDNFESEIELPGRGI